MKKRECLHKNAFCGVEIIVYLVKILHKKSLNQWSEVGEIRVNDWLEIFAKFRFPEKISL